MRKAVGMMEVEVEVEASDIYPSNCGRGEAPLVVQPSK